jgi:hypothetical protein
MPHQGAPHPAGQPGAGDWQFFGPRQGTLLAALEEKRASLPAEGGVIL